MRSESSPPPQFQGFEPLLSSESGQIDRLILAAAQQMAEHGAAGASARSIAAKAGCAASAINYNFGGLERLLSSAFDLGLAQSRTWLATRADEVAALPKSRAGALLALEYLIVQWTRAARPLALLYQEALAARAATAKDWTGLWRGFWLETAPRFGLSETDGSLLHLIFESEALYHLSQWSPALEQAALREICGHLGKAWLGAGPSPPSGALALAERTAGVITADAINPAAFKIAEAAAGVIDERGVGGLTHRAVATRAGVTTGAVTHYFRTIEDLMAGAIRGQVLALVERTSAPPDASASPLNEITTLDQFATTTRRFVVVGEDDVVRIDRRGLFLAAVRRPEMAGAGAVIRFAHGATTRNALARIFDLGEPDLTLYAGLLSRLLSSIQLGCVRGGFSRELGSALLDESIDRLGAAVRAGCA